MKLRANQVDWEAKQIRVPLNRGKQDTTGKKGSTNWKGLATIGKGKHACVKF